jgi:hypothetical protein
MAIKQTNQWIGGADAAYKQTQELPFGKIIAYSDGKTNWLSSPQGTIDMPPPVLRQMQGERARSCIALMLADRNPQTTISAVDANAITVTPAGGDSVRIDLDPATGLPARYSYQSMGRRVRRQSH